jgi:hypothetical protein
MTNAIERCTIQLRSGDFCDRASHPDAPFPICPKHAREAFEFGAQLLGNRTSINAVRLYAQMSEIQQRAKDPFIKRPCVYFLSVGDLIKVGTSGNFEMRVASYPPHRKVIYVHYCPDAASLEQSILTQLRPHLAAGNEWFHPHDDVLGLIEELRQPA